MNVRFGPPPAPRRRPRKRLILIAVAMLLALSVVFVFGRQTGKAPAPEKKASTATKTDADQKPDTTQEAPQYSLSDPASPWVITNKRRPLEPVTFVPVLTDPEVRLNQAKASENMKVAAQMAPALTELFAAAQQSGLQLALASGYRSYTTQEKVYAREVAANGQAGADAVSARPGHSEHQTGLGADISPADRRCVIETCFGATPEGVWVRENAWRHGFIIRYPEGKTAVTGYSYEPWHVRYVGKELAADMREAKIETLEEWFKLDAAPDYR